ncbi:MAG TPA: tRNA (pseudouridine(54)-N(1))-methyltransferase TrmY [Methanotrichaceae archaeon]|nr:tRNA (pseudouridine(54)-N(1))-methyltransferase TrmY [Methanotrichaceae archaeon]HQF17546.1 tRNA (pseudouridine(54)-N(1))-methyltransferase TrmY [Methanotrichaceae archaeon]HQI92112.1 tRNA (pseudouridine(54)-N(1))-methyltransferase TrmY [Methanotrichaceae archaeon]HQJ29372.1 tRNA (pseudouridine(54)-N(1))-methyltransferase TrmY [Methanotrichaceae archaeon]
MRDFVVVGHLAKTTPDFLLEDIPGTSGRMDILCRCINSAFFLSHGLRRDVRCFLVLKGGENSKLIRIDGESVRHLNPDERTTAALIRKALAIESGSEWTQSTPGISVCLGGLPKVLDQLPGILYYLREDGADLRLEGPISGGTFVLGDHLGMTEAEEQLLQSRKARVISVGPLSLHADHCIILIQSELDRVGQG